MNCFSLSYIYLTRKKINLKDGSAIVLANRVSLDVVTTNDLTLFKTIHICIILDF